ncbi:hypothetical protein TUSST3_09110 [Streptomyces sp. TUS-ST3]|uniref:hypothetical protein n=1 Tax=Streptomyces sp. TUS-ST3 TaxID=3025591 RepID=UPI0024E128A6|nr:hypothetical protein [Streptomyces sp. TUS-ST3]GLP64291.1 hypothetical protein TUSST3_09110 [Streptomyces sp. TUS-ST3]
MLTLKIQSMTIDGHPYLCPECASEAFTLDGTGWIDAFPVYGNCWQSHSWEEPLITLGDLKQINEARTGRQRAEDDDTFRLVIGGAVLEGVLHPELTVDDIRRATRDVYWARIIKPAIRRRRNAAKRAIKRPIRTAKKAAAKRTTDTVAAAKAAAIGAAWDLQAGGHQPDPGYKPEPINACPFCVDGLIDLDTHLHDTTVRCSVCHGTGEID